MAPDDLDVVVYNVLAYILACAKADVPPSAAKAKEAAKVNDTLWAMAVQSMLDEGLVTGVEVAYYYHDLGKPTVSEAPCLIPAPLIRLAPLACFGAMPFRLVTKRVDGEISTFTCLKCGWHGIVSCEFPKIAPVYVLHCSGCGARVNQPRLL